MSISLLWELAKELVVGRVTLFDWHEYEGGLHQGHPWLSALFFSLRAPWKLVKLCQKYLLHVFREVEVQTDILTANAHEFQLQALVSLIMNNCFGPEKG